MDSFADEIDEMGSVGEEATDEVPGWSRNSPSRRFPQQHGSRNGNKSRRLLNNVTKPDLGIVPNIIPICVPLPRVLRLEMGGWVSEEEVEGERKKGRS